MKFPTEPSDHRRQLGQSRMYGHADLPSRLLQWHAPRANRWEYLRVEAGALLIELLGADGMMASRLGAGDKRWIAPGTRWRIARMEAQARFCLEIHADDALPASTSQPLRAALLDEAIHVQVDDAAGLARLLDELAPGARRLVRGGFDFGPSLRAAIEASAGTLCWHPLHAAHGDWTALISRSEQAIGMLEYLGRDHAVIEAALAGALRGEGEHEAWLRNALERHLVIEEEMLFPAYLKAGGNAGWIRGLCNEHKQLAYDLDRLSEPHSRRRFLLLLDGHDEKEERIVYPDVLVRLGDEAPVLARQVVALGSTAGGGER